MNFEFVGTDPFNHKQVRNDLASLRARQIARLRNGPRLLEPIVGELVRKAYKAYHFLFFVIFWTLSWADGKFKELANI